MYLLSRHSILYLVEILIRRIKPGRRDDLDCGTEAPANLLGRRQCEGDGDSQKKRPVPEMVFRKVQHGMMFLFWLSCWMNVFSKHTIFSFTLHPASSTSSCEIGPLPSPAALLVMHEIAAHSMPSF